MTAEEQNIRKMARDGNASAVWAVEELNALRQRITLMHEALLRIAAINDKTAWEHFSLTGSYGAFDEPGSVQIAIETIKLANVPHTA